MVATDRIENCTVIKFCEDLWKISAEAYKVIKETPRKTFVSHVLVFKLCKSSEESENSI